MIVSRGLSTLRVAKLFANSLKLNSKNQLQISARQSHDWYYRAGAPQNKKMEFVADLFQGLAWWWFLWHLWTESEHITGEFPYPDPSQWSDAELGIPS